jgi:hypothetical protein
MYERVRTGIHIVLTVASIFPYLNLERKSEVDRSLDVVWTSSGRAVELSGWIQAGIEASRYSEGSGRMMLDLSGIRTVWHVVRTDGTVDK